MNKTILQTISLQDYVKRLWNHSNTKIPVTRGKGTDTAKPRSKAPYRGNKDKIERYKVDAEFTWLQYYMFSAQLVLEIDINVSSFVGDISCVYL